MLPAIKYLLSFRCVTPLYCNNSIQQVMVSASQNVSSNSNNQTCFPKHRDRLFLAVTCMRNCEHSGAICELYNQQSYKYISTYALLINVDAVQVSDTTGDAAKNKSW